jgi:hypothetical protein
MSALNPITLLPIDPLSSMFNFVNYSANQATTVIKAAPGILGSVIVNTKGTVASTVSIYDHASSATNPIAVIDSLNQAGTFEFNCALQNGLVITTTGTAAPNVTVTYK